MTNPRLALLFGILLLALGGCRSNSPFDTKDRMLNLFTPDPTDVNKNYKEWRNSFEEEEALKYTDRKIFRKANFSYPASTRFRQTIAFSSSGSTITGAILVSKQLKNGAVVQYPGTWDYAEATQVLTLKYFDTELKQNVSQVYDVVTLVQDMLLIKPRS